MLTFINFNSVFSFLLISLQYENRADKLFEMLPDLASVDLKDDLKDFLAKALEPDPAARATVEELLEHRLFNWLGESCGGTEYSLVLHNLLT